MTSAISPPPLNWEAEVENVTIEIEGLRKIDPQCLEPEVAGFQNVTNVLELLQELEATHTRLQSLGVFERSASEVHSDGGDVRIALKLQEAPVHYSLATNINQLGQATMDAEAFLPSIIGSLHSGRLTASLAGRRSLTYKADWLVPRLPYLPNYRGCIELFRAQNDFSAYSSYFENATGAMVRVARNDGRSLLEWSLALRDLLPCTMGSRKASDSVLHGPLRSLKHALRYSFTKDKLTSNGGFPTAGTVQQAMMELALPGGDVRHLKFEGDLGLARSTNSNDLTVHANISGGVLFPFAGATSRLQDRFYLGGASGCSSAFRGFRFRGIGPAHQAHLVTPSGETSPCFDHLGGDVILNSQLALYYKLPFRRLQQIAEPRAFVFGQLGSLASSWLKGAELYSDGLRGSVGFGLSVPVPIGGWLELVIGYPLKYNAATDCVNKLQLGLRFGSVPQISGNP